METKFIVYVREVHVQAMEIRAKSAEEAMSKVADGQGDALDDCLEYSHTLDSDTWTVEKCNHQD